MGTHVRSYLAVLKLIYLVIVFFWCLGSLGFRNATLAQTTLNCQSWLGAETQTSLNIYIHLEAPNSLKMYVQVLISINELDEKKKTNKPKKNKTLVRPGDCSNRDDLCPHWVTWRPPSFTSSTPSTDLSFHFYDKGSGSLSPVVFADTWPDVWLREQGGSFWGSIPVYL